MKYTLENVTENVDAWFNKDPVRPELNIEFRTSCGREVYGLKDEGGSYVAFMCVAYTNDIPSNINELDLLASPDSYIAVPYTVWRYERGAGKEIVNQILYLMESHPSVTRVVTLSPLTDMARNFHIRNGAIEIQRNNATVNFEYTLE